MSNVFSTQCLQERKEAWLGLSLLPRWGPVRIWQALDKEDDPVPLWRDMRRMCPANRVEHTLDAAQRCGARIVTWDDEEYPENLRHIQAPPVALYLQGQLCRGDAAAVSVVGSRRATPQACQMAFLLSRDLATAGITVVSGLALGVDAAAHRGALAAGGRTIAFVAGGVDRIYPQNHATLAQQISSSGAVISQFPFGLPPRRTYFSARNRILAGMALGTVVVEAPAKSGALITAHFALDHGREVFVCPADPLREHAKGSNALLRDGARVVLNAADVIEDLGSSLQLVLDQVAALRQGDRSRPGSPPGPEPTSPPHGVDLWQALADGPATVDRVAARTQRDLVGVRTGLTQLELLGYVRRESGDIYCRVERDSKKSDKAGLHPQRAV